MSQPKPRFRRNISLNVGEIQLLSRIVDTARADSAIEPGSSEWEVRRYQILEDIMRKLDAAIDSLSGG